MLKFLNNVNNKNHKLSLVFNQLPYLFINIKVLIHIVFPPWLLTSAARLEQFYACLLMQSLGQHVKDRGSFREKRHKDKKKN